MQIFFPFPLSSFPPIGACTLVFVCDFFQFIVLVTVVMVQYVCRQ